MTPTINPACNHPDTPHRATRSKKMLRDVAYVLRLTRRVKDEMMAERPDAARAPHHRDGTRWSRGSASDGLANGPASRTESVSLETRPATPGSSLLLQHLDLHLPELARVALGLKRDVAFFQ